MDALEDEHSSELVVLELDGGLGLPPGMQSLRPGEMASAQASAKPPKLDSASVKSSPSHEFDEADPKPLTRESDTEPTTQPKLERETENTPSTTAISRLPAQTSQLEGSVLPMFSAKLCARAAEHHAPGSTAVVLLLSGALNPPHIGHISTLRHAKEHLERNGMAVLGGVLSPASEMYIKHKQSTQKCTEVDWSLTASHRLELARVATSSTSDLDVFEWEASQTAEDWASGCGFPEFFDVVEALEQHTRANLPSLLIKVMFVCGGDLADRKFMQKNATQKAISLCIIQRTHDGVDQPATAGGLELVAQPGNIMLPSIAGLQNASSSQIRRSIGDAEYGRDKLGIAVHDTLHILRPDLVHCVRPEPALVPEPEAQHETEMESQTKLEVDMHMNTKQSAMDGKAVLDLVPGPNLGDAWREVLDALNEDQRSGIPEVHDPATREAVEKAMAFLSGAAPGIAHAVLSIFVADVDDIACRALSVHDLVHFTTIHDCWDLPTYKVVTDIVIPHTKANQCRYVDYMKDEWSIGKLDAFVSHPWGAKWGTLVSACDRLCQGDDTTRRSFHVWVDIFAILQHQGQGSGLALKGGTKRDLQLLTAVVARSSSVVLVSQPPSEVEMADMSAFFKGNVPSLSRSVSTQIPYRRVWCLEELRTAIVEQKPIVMLVGMIDQEEHMFKPVAGWKMFRKFIALVDVEKSEATVETDKAMILEKIRSTTGYDTTNASIRGAITGSEYCQCWIEVQAKACGIKRSLVCTSSSTAHTQTTGSSDGDSELFDVNDKRGHHQCTMLMAASGAGFTDVVLDLLAMDGIDIHTRGKNGKTALMYAGRAGHANIVQMLIEAGARANDVDDYGWSALMDAANWGNVAVVEVLLNVPEIDVNGIDKQGATALIRAAKRGHWNVIRTLLQNGAHVMIPQDANESDLLGKSYSVPLTHTVSLPRDEILEVIRVIEAAVAEGRDVAAEAKAPS